MRKGFVWLCVLIAAGAAVADLSSQVAWEIECQKPSPYGLQLTSGESIEWVARYKIQERPLSLTNATRVAFLFRPAGSTNVPFELPGVVANATNGRIRISWPASNVVAAGQYDYRILIAGVSKANMRGFGTLEVAAGFGVTTGSPPPYVQLVTSNMVDGWIRAAWSQAVSTDLVARAQATAASNAAAIAVQIAVASTSGTVVAGSWRNPDWFNVSWVDAPSNAPDTTTYRTNLDQLVARVGFNNVKHHRIAQITEQHTFSALSFAVWPTNLASVTASGYLTHLADGAVTAAVTTADFGRTNLLTLRTEGYVVDRYWGGIPGSLRAAVISNVAVSVTGATMQVFSTWNVPSNTFVRSTNLWLQPAPACAAAWSSRGGLIGAVLVTPRHAIAANHGGYRPVVGDTLKFVDATNGVWSAVVAAEKNVATDILMVKLDADIPVPPAKFLASPQEALPLGINELPLACGEVHGGYPEMQLVVGKSETWSAGAYATLAWWKAAEQPVWRDLFRHYPVPGDSSQPVIFSTGSDIVLLFALWFPTAGPNLHSFKTEIQAGITGWGDTNTLSFVDVSNYTEF